MAVASQQPADPPLITDDMSDAEVFQICELWLEHLTKGASRVNPWSGKAMQNAKEKGRVLRALRKKTGRIERPGACSTSENGQGARSVTSGAGSKDGDNDNEDELARECVLLCDGGVAVHRHESSREQNADKPKAAARGGGSEAQETKAGVGARPPMHPRRGFPPPAPPPRPKAPVPAAGKITISVSADSAGNSTCHVSTKSQRNVTGSVVKGAGQAPHAEASGTGATATAKVSGKEMNCAVAKVSGKEMAGVVGSNKEGSAAAAIKYPSSKDGRQKGCASVVVKESNIRPPWVQDSDEHVISAGPAVVIETQSGSDDDSDRLVDPLNGVKSTPHFASVERKWALVDGKWTRPA